MNTYILNYARNNKDITVNVRAETAKEAIITYCRRYGWTYKELLIDIDTSGKKWAKYGVDTNECSCAPQIDTIIYASIK